LGCVANGVTFTLGEGEAELLGESGRHARSAIGVAELPRDAAVEIEFVVTYAP